MTPRIAQPNMTTYETIVLAQLSNTPAPVEAIASRARLTRGDARLGLNGLVRRGLATLRAGSGYALASSKAKGSRRRGDVIAERFALLVGDAEERLGVLGAKTVDTIIMSSPYWKERDYGVPGQLGWEPTVDEFVDRLIRVLTACCRILSDYGLIFFNFDDHVDRGRQACIDAWLVTRLEQAGLEKFREIIWYKKAMVPNGTDNAPSHAYEKIFVFKKRRAKHHWDAFAARQEAKGGGMKRLSDVWEIAPASNSHSTGKHFAAFPAELVRRCLDVSTSARGYCKKCGAPWVRKLERGKSTWSETGSTTTRARARRHREGKAHANHALDASGKTVSMKMAPMRHVGWRPTCHHKGPPRRPLVADPFLGSGTTGIVSMQRSCDFFGVDINGDYVAKAAKVIRRAEVEARLS